jgi:hypothetical protein
MSFNAPGHYAVTNMLFIENQYIINHYFRIYFLDFTHGYSQT